MVAISGTSWVTVAAVCTALLVAVTDAHLSMTVSKAKDDTYLTTAIRVPHGCQSANNSPTLAITVTIPEGVNRLQVASVAGSNVTTETEQIASVKIGKSEVTQRIKTVRWEGGPLPTDQFLDFGMRIFLPKVKEAGKSKLIIFPILQECEIGRDLWNQIPGTDGYNHELDRDALFVEIGHANPDDTPWTENRLVKGETTSAATTVKNGTIITFVTAAVAAFYLG